ncbi:hypothetical protein [Chryseobacterium sp.]|uniref:hypothetical protein n=1 Tax=Chryseobacterium sp. TaxID=1871047 RepID=UPI0026186101|nr:hypothetical protein [Chryseobacterium sp.]
MKKVILLLPIILCEAIYAQVGINTSNPKGTFHIDGANDNPPTGMPAVSQQNNDFVVTSAGNTGIGTVEPTTKLDIRSDSQGAIKIVDGSEGADKVLMSDGNGVGTWKIPASIRATASGVFPSPTASTTSDGGSGRPYSKVYIDLTQGKWAVNAGLTISNNTNANKFWLHAYLSTSQTSTVRNGFDHLGPAGANTAYASVISPNTGVGNDGTLNMLTGSSVIDVTAPSVRIYLLIENKASGMWTFGTGAYENYFYAIPLN